MMTGVVPRPVPGAEGVRGATWIDTIAHDGEYDYDSVWRRCIELRVSPGFHGSGQGWGSRNSRTNYVYNHVGNFAAAGEAICRSLVFGGVPQRFPELRFAFLEGGIAWAVNLYADLLGHLAKRGRDAISHYDPAELDRALVEKLVLEHGPDALRERIDRLDEGLLMLSDPQEDPDRLDEFAESGVTSAEDLARIFSERFTFGCEADDPLNALAFDRRFTPAGAKLRAVFASDIGHWDVPDMREVLPEAFELVENGQLDPAQFRAFVCDHAAELLLATNPDFFAGTVLADRLGTKGSPGARR
jgi:hypothetical protein